MSSEFAIKVEGVGKNYHIYDKPHHRLLQMLYGGKKTYHRDFWALKDISFTIKKGETVGIIGRNGSGKSTLLQMICGTLTPSTGSIEVNGRVAALLELGAGFNPEFTGRENVYMNAAVLGLSRIDIDDHFDAITAFADIGDFIEQPVKTYSSGMYVRLAFAVAVYSDPSIMIVDEALAVGDFAFQYKCIRRLHELSESGVTILFVTHDVSQIQKLCSRAIYLKSGELAEIGVPRDVCDRYFADSARVVQDYTSQTEPVSENTNDAILTERVALFEQFVKPFRRGERKKGQIIFASVNDKFDDIGIVPFGSSLRLVVSLRLYEPSPDACIAFYVINEAGQLLVGSNTLYEGKSIDCDHLQTITITFENRFGDGKYAFRLYLANLRESHEVDYLDYIDLFARFTSASPSQKPRWAYYSPSFQIT